MDGATNGGMLYHEVQESKLCAVHCLNTLLQGPFFVETDLAAIAADVDREERRVMNREGSELLGDFLTQDSHNVSTAGDFSIQVLQRAVSVWNLQVIPLKSNVDGQDRDPELENAFICHSHGHWFCIRKVNGEWYNFNSLYAAPEHLSKFYLCAFLDTLNGSGWSVFLVRGNLPVECPITSSNSFGQWFTPEGARMITESINKSQASQQRQDPKPPSCSSQQISEADELVAIDEQHMYAAAVADSLIDSSRLESATEEIQAKRTSAGFSAVGSQSDVIKTEAASMTDSSPSTGAGLIQEGGPTSESSKLEGPLEDRSAVTDSRDVVLSDAEFAQKLMALYALTSEANKISDSSKVDGDDIEEVDGDDIKEADRDFIEAAMSDDEILADLLYAIATRTRGTGGKGASDGF